jgi:hypothetical protein
MQARALAVAAVLCLAVAASALAQQRPAVLAGEHDGIGKVETRIQNYEHALGVITSLRRSTSQTRLPGPPAVDCHGTCYFADSASSIAWQCAPEAKCDLHCTVKPPAGGCR